MDYCTLWFEGWWAHCCEAHDNDYAAQVGQALADNNMAMCVFKSLPDIALAYPELAGLFSVASAAVGCLMWLGVRLFGRLYYNKAK